MGVLYSPHQTLALRRSAVLEATQWRSPLAAAGRRMGFTPRRGRPARGSLKSLRAPALKVTKAGRGNIALYTCVPGGHVGFEEEATNSAPCIARCEVHPWPGEALDNPNFGKDPHRPKTTRTDPRESRQCANPRSDRAPAMLRWPRCCRRMPKLNAMLHGAGQEGDQAHRAYFI